VLLTPGRRTDPPPVERHLANIVMAWNTHRLQAMIDQTPSDYSDAVVSRLAPIGYRHINMHGILTFDLSGYTSSLLRQRLRPMSVTPRAEKADFLVISIDCHMCCSTTY